MWRIISTPHRSENNGIAERAVRIVKEGTSAVSLQSGLGEKWWSDPMECYCSLRNVQDLLTDRKTPYERRFGELVEGPIIPFGALVEYVPNSERDKARIDQFGKKVLPGFFIGDALIAGRIWKGNILIADIEELDKLDVSGYIYIYICIYIYIPEDGMQKKSWEHPKDGESVFLVPDGSAKLSGRDYQFQEPTLRRKSSVRRENLCGEPHGDREEFRPEETKGDAGINEDVSSNQGDFTYRHHIEPRVQLYVPKKESFLIPL